VCEEEIRILAEKMTQQRFCDAAENSPEPRVEERKKGQG
jgi:hypothetical protein